MNNQSLASFSLGLLLAGSFPGFAAEYHPDLTKQLGFPIYQNNPPGKQLSGAHAPATTPALAPAESQKQILLPPGFEARLFACEPEVVNPVAMTWDERGRLWVLELYEYPKGAPAGTKPRDRIKILEDTDADGKADKVTVWADGLNLACGLLLGNGGAYVGAAPDFLFLQDTDGDGKADKRTVLKTGFGLDDRHELLNGFTWGPDGWLYLTHGVFTHSKVRNPDDPKDSGVVVDAAVARYHPERKTFEVFADGTSNPWGVDFDRQGNAFVSACVIPHFFHMAPGGLYQRQGGQPAYPYAYGLLPSSVDFLHYRAAHAGVDIYQGNQFPAAWQGHAFIGNIHQSAINLNHLEPVGATFKATKATQLLGPPKGDFEVGGGNFLVSKDPWFRPVSTQTGPDGALWIMDWYDRYPCYQNANADPDGVDREHGRIWRVVYVGSQPGKKVPSRPFRDMDLTRLSGSQLVELLKDPNSWQRRTAQRLLSERKDPKTKAALVKLAQSGKTVESRLAGLWTLHGAGFLEEPVLDAAAVDKDLAVRTWAARLTGERRLASTQAHARLVKLAGDFSDAVRAGVATALRQFVSGSLTVNTPPLQPIESFNQADILGPLEAQSEQAVDPLLPHLIWMAAEPMIARDPKPALDSLAAGSSDPARLSASFTRKIMRRICDQTDPAVRRAQLDAVVRFLDRASGRTEIASAALDGLLEGLKSKGAPPSVPVGPVLEKYYRLPALADRARRLGVLWGDVNASLAIIQQINETGAPAAKRREGIQAAREAKSDAARSALLELLRTEKDPGLLGDGLRALGEVGHPDAATADAVLGRWNDYPPATRRLAADILATRRRWAQSLLSALEAKTVAPGDVSATAIRALTRPADNEGDQAKRAAAIFGKVRDADADKLKLIESKKRIVLRGEPDIQAGREVARKTCYVCHKLHGEGAEVGPDLTGVGRSTLDALLANIIDPNQIIGAGYENVEVETKDGRSVSGRMVENTETRVRLLSSGPKEDIIAKSDIAVENGRPKIRVGEVSVMPEGLEQMPDGDFRNLIWFLLNPPEDHRPWTPALRRELIGDEGPAPKSALALPDAPRDLESVALWNPEWRVVCPTYAGAPAKLSEYAGRRNVLMTHPGEVGASPVLERSLSVPASGKSSVRFQVAAREQGDWELRVVAEGKLLHQERVDRRGDAWKQVKVDLSSFAGRSVTLRLEQRALAGPSFGYWRDLWVQLGQETAQAR
jgi:putative membrane-bound dehydrogenase-like protein